MAHMTKRAGTAAVLALGLVLAAAGTAQAETRYEPASSYPTTVVAHDAATDKLDPAALLHLGGTGDSRPHDEVAQSLSISIRNIPGRHISRGDVGRKCEAIHGCHS